MSLDSAFGRNTFAIHPKRNGREHEVYDESGTPILFIAGPPHVFRTFVAVMSAGFAGTLIGLLGLMFVASLSLADGVTGWLAFADILVVAPFCMFVIGNFLSPKRRLTIYRDKTQSEPLVELRQDRRLQFPHADYTVRMASGTVLGHVRRSLLNRKSWYYADARNQPVAVVQWGGVLARRLTFYGCQKYSDASATRRLVRMLRTLERNMADVTDFLDDDGNPGEIATLTRRAHGVWVLHLFAKSRIDPRVGLAIAALSKTG